MHELSIAMSLIDVATEESDRRGSSRVHAVHLKLGLLSGVVKEALQFSYKIACQGTWLENSELVIEDVPVVIYCRNCDADQLTDSRGELSNEIKQGRELEVVALELEELEELVS
jgi:hydrogenase nickel incorporation protein HypA/HybF